MARPRLYTPEERHARDLASKQRSREKHRAQARARFNERYPTRYKTNAKARHDARMAAMTPEERDAYRAANRAAKQRQRAKDPAATRAQAKALRQKDPTKARGYVKKYRLKQLEINPHYGQEQYQKHKARDPQRINEYSATRRARIRGAKINNVTPAQRALVLTSANGFCAYCAFYAPGCTLCLQRAHPIKGNNKYSLSVDHITAVENGGDNTLHNLVACCRSCNSKKKISPNPLPVQPILL